MTGSRDDLTEALAAAGDKAATLLTRSEQGYHLDVTDLLDVLGEGVTAMDAARALLAEDGDQPAGERGTALPTAPLADLKRAVNGCDRQVVMWSDDSEGGRWTLNGQVGIWSEDDETCEFAYPDDLCLVPASEPEGPTPQPEDSNREDQQ